MKRELKEILGEAESKGRISEEDALLLLDARGNDVWEIAAAANRLREEKVGRVATYVRNQNLHITNICRNLCGFCNFGRPAFAPDAYLHDEEHIRAASRLARERKVTEICFLSGVHPEFDAGVYEALFSWVHEECPEADLHGASPDEIAWAAEKSGISTREAIERFREAGLGTLQGTAAEILVEPVRSVICPSKISGEEWVRIIKEAHSMGIRSTATIMYGSVDTAADRAAHLSILRDIQDETGGFTELVPLSYLHLNTSLYARGLAPAGATGREDLLLFAVARLFLDNFDHIQVSWGKVGIKMASLGLQAGGDDLGGTMFVDAVSTGAGGDAADYLDPEEMGRIAEDAGLTLRQRTTLYELI